MWVVAALLLWRTEVPGGLDVQPTLAPFAALDLARAERHDSVLRLLALVGLVAELVALFALSRVRLPLRGPALVRAAEVGAFAAAALLVARLPFGLATLWWQRRYGIAELGYGTWFFDLLGPLVVRAALLGFACTACLWLARRFGLRWWLAAAPVFVVIGVAVIVVQPLLSQRLEPVRRQAIVRQVEELAAREGLPRPEVEVRRTRGRTRLLNAEALGIGPTTRVILWESTLALPAAERAFLVAHELAHVQRKHLWKGLAWFVLLVVPALALLARLAPLRAPEGVPRALLVAFVLLLVATPIANTISRRYEAEADWIALETTHDPVGAKRFLADLAEAGVRDPSPPRWWTVLFGTHPTLAERAGMADANARRSREGP
ncbi:MAG: endopeptidase [Gaiellaceae bacterium]|nr:endopeptidase [Gaiellaceae bacterium]